MEITEADRMESSCQAGQPLAALFSRRLVPDGSRERGAMMRGRSFLQRAVWTMPIAAVTSSFLILVSGAVAFGAPPARLKPPKPAQVRAVKHVTAVPTRFTPPAPKPKPYTPTRTHWPRQASATVTLAPPA